MSTNITFVGPVDVIVIYKPNECDVVYQHTLMRTIIYIELHRFNGYRSCRWSYNLREMADRAWMQEAQNQSEWRAMGEVCVQQ